MKKEKFIVSGMTCSACSARVEKAVSGLDGTDEVSVNLLTGTMQVIFDENKIDETGIIASVVKAGYGAKPADAAGQSGSGKPGQTSGGNGNPGGNGKSEEQSMKQRFVWSLICLIPMMYFSMGPMLHHMTGIPVLWTSHEDAMVSTITQFLLLLPVLFLNRIYFIRGFKNLWHRSPNMDSLIAVGSGASLVYGVFAIYRMAYGLGHGQPELVSHYHEQLYFESSAMIVTLITLGKYLESKSKKKTSKAIESLMELAPAKATVIRNGKEVTIASGELVEGDLVVVKPGQRIPADGTIEEGRTSVDEAAISGESIPVEKEAGSKVISATMNKSGRIVFRAERVGKNSTISQIIKLVEEASASKAPIAKMADKIAGIFVPTVMAIAVLTAIVWLLAGNGFEFALNMAISVLVISCPCALGLATPVAIMVGTGKGAENGILIKSGEALETAHHIDTVVLDKTGTITEGRPVVTDVLPVSVSEAELVSLACGLEAGSEHPLAEAIISYGRKSGLDGKQVEGFHAVFGKGIEARCDGKKIYGGNEAFMEELGVEVSELKEQMNRLADEGKTPMLFAVEQKVAGIIAVADVEKPSSREAIRRFEQMKIRVVMLTGDNERTALALKKRLNISEVIAGVLPADKERHIAKLQKEGHRVAMIGDGINDAPALARADVGIAIGAGTDIAMDSADAVLMRNDLLDAVSAIRLSKSVIRNIKENLFWAFFYNTVGIPVAAGVLYPLFGLRLSPMIGAAAMSLSSVCVVSNALRLRRFQPENRGRKENAVSRLETGSQETVVENLEKERKKIMELKIEGMMCEHCKANVEKVLNAMDGVESAEVNLAEKKADVVTSREIDKSEFKKVIEDAGYTLL